MDKFKGFLVIIFSSFLIFGSNKTAYSYFDPRTVPNNKIGIHLLNPSEVEEASKLINNNGGDWGYVTVPIQPTDRDQDKWQTFMHACRDLHLIPIVRITTIPFGGTWSKGLDTDLVDFANFMSELDWPISNRYIVLFNEVNRDTEWGGTVDPISYAKIAKNAYTIFKERSTDYFLLGPALDSALPNSSTSLSATNYLQQMRREDNNVFTYFDGWASHSYPNPGFSASPRKTGLQSIVSYKYEMSAVGVSGKPVFITETGWDQNVLDNSTIYSYWRQAQSIWEKDPSVIAVTPFVLQGGEQFSEFSLKTTGGELSSSGLAIKELTKISGMPPLSDSQVNNYGNAGDNPHLSSSNSSYHAKGLTLKIENFFRTLFGLLPKGNITVGDKEVYVELATKPASWEQGLSGRDSLEKDSGMLFIFNRPHVPLFWMKNMKFPLDIIWIKDGKIENILSNVPLPTDSKLPTYSPDLAIDWVLEVPAGTADLNEWEAGTEVNILE